MKKIPKENILRSVIAFRKEGYDFLRNRTKKHNTDLFQLNFPMKKVICTTGAEAAELFYNSDEFRRKGAIPKRIQKSLTGNQAIQTTDAEVHANRKKLFMTLMTKESIQELTDLFRKNWKEAAEGWEAKREIHLFEEAPKILFKSICSWTGTPYKEEEVTERSHDLIAMVDAFGAIGKRHWRGRKARERSEKWMEEIVQDTRNGNLNPPKNSALSQMAFHEEASGELFSNRLAAIEMLNLIRPTVAIAYYIVFGAVALEEHPEYKERIKNGDGAFTERFVHEVRRFYPIGPFLGGTVKKGFQWKGYFFPKDSLVLLDIYGTNRDPRHWEKPDEFWPDHFLNWDKNPFDFIPQGGGDHFNGHRCAGEWVTIELLKASMELLTKHMEYEVPIQDLSFPLERIPTYPRSGVILRNVLAASTLKAI